MKKYLILLMVILLVACQSDTIEKASIVIDLNTVDGIYIDDQIYVPVHALDPLNIDVLENDNVAYLSTLLSEKVSNDRFYNWYIDQGNTGQYAGDNCGPASSVMAAKWQDPSYDKTPQEARSEFQSSGGWWYTDDIEDYFDKHDVIYEVDDYDGTFELVDSLDEGAIILLCIDTTYISDQDFDDQYMGKFYGYEGGHFIIVKGYTYIDYDLYFEVYDSNNWGETYSDGSPKGKDRLYLSEEVDEAILNWWAHYFIIEDQ